MIQKKIRVILLMFATMNNLKTNLISFPTKNYFYDNEHLVKENVYNGMMNRFIYEKKLGRCFRAILNRAWFSFLTGIYYDSSFSKRSIKNFVSKYNIDMSECEKNIDEFKTFNEFFTRTLKPGSRQIDQTINVLISPADSKLFVIENITKQTKFEIKNLNFDLIKFFKSEELANKFEGGALLVFRLAPYDYHHFHFPFDAKILNMQVINGIYDSVNPVAYKAGYLPLIENERHLTILKSDIFGEVAFVSVGAMCVGKIVENYQENKNYKKGDDAGYFAFGGSTVAMMFKKDQLKIDERFLKHSKEGYETKIRFGERVGVKI
ncbi:MAG: Phosphatidylserine decarboxylase proenzyme [candidate division TM6 bacterium GW2011_GWE2_31_21]|nr:MAG: Phosphatidylserine decarboxylase proenzyme [candidate division TM6 bacterium GW2011_GWE2_31_21]KKP53826.1 MAG: Phosphatidylserine decarboxylase proenzyme [candidate division TM6 bacterium GW2011_GWF2_33_332]